MTDEDIWTKLRRIEEERRLQRQQSDIRYGSTVEDILRLAADDPVVGTIFSAWRNGRFASFEAALIHTVVLLATEKKRLIELATKQMSLKPIIAEREP